MAFQLKAKESVSDGIRRNVRRQIEKALDRLGAESKPHQRDASKDEAAHRDVRKCFKKVRAALRLVREDLGDDIYREENWCFRDAGRPLREVRDAEVLVEAVDKLASAGRRSGRAGSICEDPRDFARKSPGSDPPRTRGRSIRCGGRSRHARARETSGLEDRARRLGRPGGWPPAYIPDRSSRARFGGGKLEHGEFHEWRKQARHLWGQLQLLEAAWTGSEKELGDRNQRLVQLLGDDHDLAVLRETLAADPLAYGGHRILKDVFAVIDRQREELKRQAFALGRTLYKDLPKVFTGRIEAYWKAWAAEVEAVKPPTIIRSGSGG